MVSTAPPFGEGKQGVSPEKVIRRVCSKKVKYEREYGAELPQNLRDLLKKLLKKEPDERIGSWGAGAKDIKLHPWFIKDGEIDFNRIRTTHVKLNREADFSAAKHNCIFDQ
jgi:hypothetical protein